MKPQYLLHIVTALEQMKYLPICRTGDNGSIICARHDLCLKNVVIMTWMKWKLDTPSFPIPKYNPPVIWSWNQNVTICIEAYSVHTTFVLFQLPVEIKSKHKILEHKIHLIIPCMISTEPQDNRSGLKNGHYIKIQTRFVTNINNWKEQTVQTNIWSLMSA